MAIQGGTNLIPELDHEQTAALDRVLAIAPNVPDPAFSVKGVLRALLARGRALYRGVTVDDIADIVLEAQQQKTSIRMAASNRRAKAAEYGEDSPGKSAAYEHLLGNTTEQELAHRGTLVALRQVIMKCRRLGKQVVRIIVDEFDETTSSKNRFRDQTEVSESGKRAKPTKRAIKRRKKSKFPHIPYDLFTEWDDIGHEYIVITVIFADKTRMLIRVYPTDAETSKADAILQDALDVVKILQRYLHVELLTADRRWFTKASITILAQQATCDWIVRGQVGRTPSNPTSPETRKGHRQMREGTRQPNRHFLENEAWALAKAVETETNVFVYATQDSPFQDFDVTVTSAWGFLPRGKSIPKTSKLRLGVNMGSMLFITNRPPTHEMAAATLKDYLSRWEVEEDIKELKGYRVQGSGPEMTSRILMLTVAVVLENLAQYIRAATRFKRWAAEFTSYTFNELLKEAVLQSAAAKGWLPAIPPG